MSSVITLRILRTGNFNLACTVSAHNHVVKYKHIHINAVSPLEQLSIMYIQTYLQAELSCLLVVAFFCCVYLLNSMMKLTAHQ